MKLTLISTDNCTCAETCPAKYATSRGTVVYIGAVVTDPDALGELAGHVGPGEIAIEVPAYIAEA